MGSYVPNTKAEQEAMLKEAGCHYESEHHYIAHLLNHTAPFGEINAVGKVWTTRTTSHIPIKEVSDHLTLESIGRDPATFGHGDTSDMYDGCGKLFES